MLLRSGVPTRPNRVTWFVWTIVGAMLLASYRAAGATSTLWVPAALVVGTFSIALLSLKFGQGGWRPVDVVCCIGAAVGFLLWRFLASPEAALFSMIGTDFVGLVPTLVKSYREPQGEHRLAWSIAWAGSLLNVCAIGTWEMAVASYPLYLFVGNSAVLLLLVRPGERRRANPISLVSATDRPERARAFR
jgi:hypothetical protein